MIITTPTSISVIRYGSQIRNESEISGGFYMAAKIGMSAREE